MKRDTAKILVKKLLTLADIEINGSRPCDIHVRDERLYGRVLTGGSLGLGEAYMDGWWDAEKMDDFFERILRVKLDKKIRGNWKMLLSIASYMIFNHQRPSKSFEVGQVHYDIGNDLYRAMLDQRMIYSCGYWKEAENLDQAQEAKLDLICRKIKIKPGQHILDIGCGWGGFAKFAAEKYGAQVTGVTISKEQAALAKEKCTGLPVEILIQDYRDITGTFDHVVSIGMFEHVGYKNYRRFMRVAHDHLKDGGFFLLHTIGTNVSTTSTDPWIMKYIFPGGMLPSIKQIGNAAENIFVMEDWHNLVGDYEKTLLAWNKNFDTAWPRLEKKYGKRFYRMWKYYLLGAAATFRTRNNQLWQIVFSKSGSTSRYESIR